MPMASASPSDLSGARRDKFGKNAHSQPLSRDRLGCIAMLTLAILED
jgi:hypothetical protein